MPDQPLFTSLDASKLHSNLLEILCRIASEKGRVEITDCDGGTCVLLSKDELDGLEEAIEILSQTPAAHDMEVEVEQVLTAEKMSAGA
jgi:PHD/YefM family antitoxin component YafN of YafNO toxin-antitoxin module